MATPAASAVTTPRLAFDELLSDDGTRLRAWTNDPDGTMAGPTVLLCNGLGMGAYAWPALLRPDCGVRVVSWNHRGMGGSARPRDRRRVGVDDLVEDALSVLDHFGVDKAVMVGWSTGVATMFELARRHPERVTGLFAVAGTPGDIFSTMLGPLHLPRPITRRVSTVLCRSLRYAGWAATPVSTRWPVGRRTLDVVSHSGLMLPVADVELSAEALREFLATPLGWYFHMALRTAGQRRISLRDVRVPTAFVAARWDLLAGPRQIASAARRVPGATYAELRGSHFVMMEQPEAVHDLLLAFLRRVA